MEPGTVLTKARFAGTPARVPGSGGNTRPNQMNKKTTTARKQMAGRKGKQAIHSDLSTNQTTSGYQRAHCNFSITVGTADVTRRAVYTHTYTTDKISMKLQP